MREQYSFGDYSRVEASTSTFVPDVFFSSKKPQQEDDFGEKTHFSEESVSRENAIRTHYAHQQRSPIRDQYDEEDKRHPRRYRFLRKMFLLSILIIITVIMDGVVSEALPNISPIDPSVLAYFRDVYDGKEVELEKMVR